MGVTTSEVLMVSPFRQLLDQVGDFVLIIMVKSFQKFSEDLLRKY